MIATILALTLLGTAPAVIPDPPKPYDWVCDHLNSAPTLFGILGIGAEVDKRNMNPDGAREAIIITVRNDCPQHAPLLHSLPLVVGGK